MSSPQSSASTRVWFKSSYSGGNTTECVECARTPTGSLVRDSKRPEGPTLALRATAWQKFVDGVSVGQIAPLPPRF
ncbi:DUF397 domain-containing protein [Streptomyces sp. SR27]|uniref:DUF397 domain-containing protein n=1 Tax=Streptomyces sp. SR27 TaxID=3076630 RepID=UPI00295B58B7|nr:DUF397 domain-containing protein [Streptomyces sp. SR27]MDV9188420.1 DUF397 domain-containing protein [Streptomyces sp. SR27]